MTGTNHKCIANVNRYKITNRILYNTIKPDPSNEVLPGRRIAWEACTTDYNKKELYLLLTGKDWGAISNLIVEKVGILKSYNLGSRKESSSCFDSWQPHRMMGAHRVPTFGPTMGGVTRQCSVIHRTLYHTKTKMFNQITPRKKPYRMLVWSHNQNFPFRCLQKHNFPIKW